MTLQTKSRIFKILLILMMVFVLAGFNTKPLVLGAKPTAKKILKLKKEAFGHVEQLSEQLTRTAGQIWEFNEIALEEYKSSQLLAQLLKDRVWCRGSPGSFCGHLWTGSPGNRYTWRI